MLKLLNPAICAALIGCLLTIPFSKGKGQSVQRGGNDTVLVNKLSLLCKKMRHIAPNFTQSGIISITDESAKDHQTDDLGFMFCKQGNEFYYKLGKAIMLNENGLYLYIDLRNKTILISPQKKVVYDIGFKQFADVAATVRSENYKISSTESGNEQTISVVNEHHITCKQYALSFDKRNMKINKLYMRLTNINDPLRTDNEKIISATISRWDDTADLGAFLTAGKVVNNIKGRWVLTGEFKNYQLISM